MGALRAEAVQLAQRVAEPAQRRSRAVHEGLLDDGAAVETAVAEADASLASLRADHDGVGSAPTRWPQMTQGNDSISATSG